MSPSDSTVVIPSEAESKLHGAARVVWLYGAIFAAMFLIYAVWRLGMAALDWDFSQLDVALILGAYGGVHLYCNTHFKLRQKWARLALVGLYSIWIVICIVKVITAGTDIDRLTGIVFGVLSAVALFLLLARVRAD